MLCKRKLSSMQLQLGMFNLFYIPLQVLPWTVTLGFMLGFGVVIAKLYRVIHIFKNPSPNRTVRTSSPPHTHTHTH